MVRPRFHDQQQARYRPPYKGSGRDPVRFDSQAVGEPFYDPSVAKTCESLPELLKEVDTNLVSCKKELTRLPARFIGDPVGEVWRLLADFKRDIGDLVTGRPDDGKHGLMQRIRQARQEFREAIFQGAPRFKPYAKPSSGPESHRTRQDTAEGLEPEVNGRGTVVYIDEVTERAETSVPCPGDCPFDYLVLTRAGSGLSPANFPSTIRTRSRYITSNGLQRRGMSQPRNSSER